MPNSVVLYQANGDSIASADSFPALLHQAHHALDSATDTSGMVVTFAEPSGLRAMTLQRAIQDYLPDNDRAQVIAQLKAQASASKKMAAWLQSQEPTGEASVVATEDGEAKAR
jgi:hypothetical protein